MKGTHGVSLPSRATLEAYLVGDLAPAEIDAVERAMAADPSLEAWVSRRRTEQAAFAYEPRRRPFAALVAEAEGPASMRAKQGPGLRWLWATAVAASAASVVALTPALDDRGHDVVGPSIQSTRIRAKGHAPQMTESTQLTVRAALRSAAGTRPMSSGDSVRPGDRLRLMVEDGEGGYATVLLEEESGDVSVLYHPEELGRLEAGTHALPGSLEFDQKLGRERIYVIVSASVPDVESWQAQIRTFRGRGGYHHGWLPEGRARVSVVEYTKIP